MKFARVALVILPACLSACKSGEDDKETLAELRDIKIELKDEKIEGGLEKAMESYKRFLEETPETAMTPEAIRRLADLKIEKEYGITQSAGGAKSGAKAVKPESLAPVKPSSTPAPVAALPKGKTEKQSDFEKRATTNDTVKATETAAAALPEGDDLENANAAEAVALYEKLLAKYPLYERNDQVLYQLSRAYEELGKVDKAMEVMNRLVKEFPNSRYIDEVQFRRGEYYFTRRKFLDAEDAYKAIVAMGSTSPYYELALYKLGWTFYKQDMYEDAQHQFMALLDHKVKIGYDFEKPQTESDKQRVADTFRVISLGFSNLGGSDAVMDYFEKNGRKPYEVDVYSNLGEHYLEKERYSDAAATFKAFVKRNPYHKVSPRFDMRVIEIYKAGGFPDLVIEANKDFAKNYGLKSQYWKHFDVKAYPEVLGYLKTNLKELANHYHVLYRDKTLEKEKPANFAEALHWYKEYLESFPKETESPGINYQMADLLLENQDFGQAAKEYERTAYDYPAHEKSATAGYQAVYAYREHEKVVPERERNQAKREVIRVSLKFADSFPTHEKAAVVLGAATDDLFVMKDYPQAIAAGRKLIQNFPKAEQSIVRAAWLVVAHSSFELANYAEAEEGYLAVLKLTPAEEKSRAEMTEHLAASIYKQGEVANKAQDYKTAATHFLRVAQAAPTSKIRPVADYDGATALIQLKEWDKAAEVLLSFRKNFPEHELQPEVTKKVAFVYKESGKLALAAAEYERIETESKDEQVRRGALLMAADLYQQAEEPEKALQVYKRFVAYFPKPLELALEARHKIAEIHKSRNNTKEYLAELKQIVDADANAGNERTDRTRYLGGTSSLVLTEPLFTQFQEIKLVKPFEKNLAKKKTAMKAALEGFGKLPSYEVGEVTAAATFYLAEIYMEFSKALTESERPTNLNNLEMEEYEAALEDQAFPFEEKSIKVHEKNLELLTLGVYNSWIDKTLEKLAVLVPARYAKYEESSGYVASIESFTYALATPEPTPPAAQAATTEGGTEESAASEQDGAEEAATNEGANAETAEAAPEGTAPTAAPAPSPTASEPAVSTPAQPTPATGTEKVHPAPAPVETDVPVQTTAPAKAS